MVAPVLERYTVTESGCWLWDGATTSKGYGRFRVNRKYILAHRYFFEVFTSTRVPPGMHLDHLCRRKSCVNPDHLEIVTPRENNLRSNSPSAINARRTECKNGHALSGDNLLISPKGDRRCRACNRILLQVKRDKRYAEYYTRYNEIVDEGRYEG
jgi:hypothetical protein